MLAKKRLVGAFVATSCLRGATAKLMIAAAAILTMTAEARAELITYTGTIVATGSLGGTDFADALVTITATGDTADIIPVDIPGIGIIPGYFAIPVSARVEVAGLAALFTNDIVAYVAQPVGVAGFVDNTVFGTIFDTANSDLLTYDLASPVGPVSGTAQLNPGLAFATTLGAFVIGSASGNSTFEARLAAVPEPSSLALFGLGVVGLGARRCRRSGRRWFGTAELMA